VYLHELYPQFVKNIIRDLEFWAILGFNLILVYAYLNDITGFDTLVVLFYFQSLFIGFQYLIRQIVASYRESGGSIIATLRIPLFFTVHFGMFHLIYAIFLLPIVNKIPGPINFQVVYSVFLIFLINTIFSLVSDIKRDKQNGSSSVGLLFIPYLRIVPMHLFIILAFNYSVGEESTILTTALVIFLILKALSDLIMHIIVNQTWRSYRPKVLGYFM